MSGERIPCVNPRCRRTADAAKHRPGAEIVCGKCWRNVPAELRDRYRLLRKRDRTMQRRVARRVALGTICQDVIDGIVAISVRRRQENWARIRDYFLAPKAPVGLEGFLQEIGL